MPSPPAHLTPLETHRSLTTASWRSRAHATFPERSRTRLARAASRLALLALLGIGVSHAPEARAESPTAPHAAAEPLAASSGPVATFIGFRRLGPSRDLIYVELTEAPEVDFKGRGRTLEYTMQRTRVSTRNNKNPLLARHFDSVVESAQLVPIGKHLKLVIQLRRDALPESRVVRHGQSATLEIEIRGVKDGG